MLLEKRTRKATTIQAMTLAAFLFRVLYEKYDTADKS
jgi:hypothetical protein